MNPIRWDLMIYPGATFRQTRIWKVGDSVSTATPVDLTACTARMHIRPTVDSPNKLLELTTENGGITLGGVAGSIEVHIKPEDSKVLQVPPNNGAVYDMEIEFQDGAVRVLFAGEVKIAKRVTRG